MGLFFLQAHTAKRFASSTPRILGSLHGFSLTLGLDAQPETAIPLRSCSVAAFCINCPRALLRGDKAVMLSLWVLLWTFPPQNSQRLLDLGLSSYVVFIRSQKIVYPTLLGKGIGAKRGLYQARTLTSLENVSLLCKVFVHGISTTWGKATDRHMFVTADTHVVHLSQTNIQTTTSLGIHPHNWGNAELCRQATQSLCTSGWKEGHDRTEI